MNKERAQACLSELNHDSRRALRLLGNKNIDIWRFSGGNQNHSCLYLPIKIPDKKPRTQCGARLAAPWRRSFWLCRGFKMGISSLCWILRPPFSVQGDGLILILDIWPLKINNLSDFCILKCIDPFGKWKQFWSRRSGL